MVQDSRWERRLGILYRLIKDHLWATTRRGLCSTTVDECASLGNCVTDWVLGRIFLSITQRRSRCKRSCVIEAKISGGLRHLAGRKGMRTCYLARRLVDVVEHPTEKYDCIPLCQVSWVNLRRSWTRSVRRHHHSPPHPLLRWLTHSQHSRAWIQNAKPTVPCGMKEPCQSEDVHRCFRWSGIETAVLAHSHSVTGCVTHEVHLSVVKQNFVVR